MTITTTSVQVADPEGLHAACSAVLGNVGDLVERLAAELPESRKAQLLEIVETGGRMGIEVTINGKNMPEFVLIAIELEGKRHVFHTVRPLQA